MSSSLLLLLSLLTIVNKFRNNNNNLTIVMNGGKEGIVATPHWLIPVRGHNSDKTKQKKYIDK